VASRGDNLYISRKAIRERIALSFVAAMQGVVAQTSGQIKVAESAIRASGSVVSAVRARARIGVNHKEDVAVLAADMRGSTRLAEKSDADDIFVLMQCFIPMLAFIAVSLDGEVVGLRGDGLIAAFGFGESTWRPCVNRAYEAGMLMIEATRDVLRPFLSTKGIPTAEGMGVGVDCGRVTVTKIGLGDAMEATAYGSSVNSAAKNSKKINKLWLSANANRRLHKEDDDGIFTPGRTRLVGT